MGIAVALTLGFIGGFVLGVVLMRSAIKFNDYNKVDSSHHDWFDEK